LPRLSEYLVRTGRVPALSLESLRTALRRGGLSLKTAGTGMTLRGTTTMIPGAFDYHAPTSIGEATELLAKLGDAAKILSGGQSLIPLMKLRLATPQHLVDINGISGLAYIREADGFLKIGALTRESDLEDSDLVRTRYPIFFDTSKVIADPLVRNLATVCGNLAHGDPANDHPATMLALGAEVVAVGQKGERRIPVASFFAGPFTTALEPDEILTEIRIPIPPPQSGGAYLKLERKVGDFATAAVATQVTLDANGACERVGIGLTNVGPTPIKAKKAEAFLKGKRLEEGAIKQAAQLAAEEAQPTSDLRGPAEYKRDLVRVLTARALRKALERAGGGR
jgi:carbon-monoxide dehydrogenase medium subunit